MTGVVLVLVLMIGGSLGGHSQSKKGTELAVHVAGRFQLETEDVDGEKVLISIG